MYKKSVDAEAYYHACLILYRPWRDESELVGDNGTYYESYYSVREQVEKNVSSYNLHADEMDTAIDRLATESAPETV